MDGGPNLLDLRFADDILLFAQSRVEAGNLLDALVSSWIALICFLHVERKIVITNEAQPPQTITTTGGMILRVLPRDAG